MLFVFTVAFLWRIDLLCVCVCWVDFVVFVLLLDIRCLRI